MKMLTFSACLFVLASASIHASPAIPKASQNEDTLTQLNGGSQCFIQNKQFPGEFLYSDNQFVPRKFSFSFFKTVSLRGMSQLDAYDKIVWRIERVEGKKDAFYLKKKSHKGKDEYLCSMVSILDMFSGQHELKRLDDPTKVNKENCEWRIEPIEDDLMENEPPFPDYPEWENESIEAAIPEKDDKVAYTIRNLAHNEPIFADGLSILSALIKRSVYLKHEKPVHLSDNYKWNIECHF
jgi:hypothetical protein